MTHAHTSTALRAAGSWLAIASLLMVLALVFHGPIAADLGDQMQRIAGASMQWQTVHWTAAAALSLYAVSALIVLSAGTRLTETWWTTTAWAVVPIGVLWTMLTAVSEATVIANAAADGSLVTFDRWWSFGEGLASGFSVFALAVATIAGHDARSSGTVTAPWAAWLAAVAGLASFAGWALGMWAGIAIGNLLWLLASVLMCLWLLWFGFALATSERARHHMELATEHG